MRISNRVCVFVHTFVLCRVFIHSIPFHSWKYQDEKEFFLRGNDLQWNGIESSRRYFQMMALMRAATATILRASNFIVCAFQENQVNL